MTSAPHICFNFRLFYTQSTANKCYIKCAETTALRTAVKTISIVTRLGNLLDFGKLFKICGNNKFAQIFHIHRQFLYKCQNH